jgi:hypothetical protein
MNISAQEDAIISALTGLKNVDTTPIFRMVASIGRKAKPAVINFPAAFACYVSDSPIQQHPRIIVKRRFGVAIVVQNVAGEKQAADNLYALIEKVFTATLGQKLGLADINPFEYGMGAVEQYDDGRITFLMILETSVFFPIFPKLS